MRKIGAGFITVALTGLAAAGASAQTAGTVTTVTATPTIEGCVVAAPKEMQFKTSADGTSFFTTTGEKGEMTVTVRKMTEAGEAHAVTVGHSGGVMVATPVEGHHITLVRNADGTVTRVEPTVVDVKELPTAADGTIKADQKFHVKRPAAKAPTDVTVIGEPKSGVFMLERTAVAAAHAGAMTVGGQPVHCQVIIRTKDDNQ